MFPKFADLLGANRALVAGETAEHDEHDTAFIAEIGELQFFAVESFELEILDGIADLWRFFGGNALLHVGY